MDTIKVTPQLIKQLQTFEEKKNKYMTNEEVQDEINHLQHRPKNFKYYFQHPYLRLLTVITLIILNIYLYAEDPIVLSHTQCHLPLLGDIYSFIFANYPSNGYSAVKFFLWLFAIIFGIIVGKVYVHHYLFTQKLKLKLFTIDGQGSWMVILLFTLCVLYYQSAIYNAIIILEGKEYETYRVTQNMHVLNKNFAKITALVTWFGEFLTAWMILDMMLQDKQYPSWLPSFRKWWSIGYKRVIIFWSICFVLAVVVVCAITLDFIKWDDINEDMVTTNELERSFLASVILCIDLLIIMQDWDFPHFSTVVNMKLPGLDVNKITFSLPFCYVHNRKVQLTGKWFNYGFLMIVMIFDMARWRNQIFYEPFHYGQYVNAKGHIYTVSNLSFLETANRSTLTYEYRHTTSSNNNNTTTAILGLHDEMTKSYYKGFDTKLKGTAFLPFLFTLFIFIYLVYTFAQQEGEQEKVVRHWYESKFAKKRKTRKIQPEMQVVEDVESSDDEDYDFMENTQQKSFNFIFLHPYMRLVIVYTCVLLCSVHITEDPVGHSQAIAKVDVLGNAYSMLFTKYPSKVEFILLKIFIWLCAFLTGLWIGKYIIHHVFLIGILKLKLFSNGQGTWIVSFCTVIVSLFCWSLVYNEIVKVLPELHGHSITNEMSFRFETFMKGVAVTSCVSHLTLAFMVTDTMLQETHYHTWAKWLRHKWKTINYLRMVSFWLLVFTFTLNAILLITLDLIEWNHMAIGGSNELGRIYLAAFIILFDLLIIIQDWQFPRFKPNPAIKLPGLPNPNFKLNLCCFEIEAKGKWFTYGLLGIILLIDVYNFKNQFMYEPKQYEQFTNRNHEIVSIINSNYFLPNNQSHFNETWFSHNNSKAMKTKYIGFTVDEKGSAFLIIVIGILSMLAFGIKRSVEIKRAKNNKLYDKYNRYEN